MKRISSDLIFAMDDRARLVALAKPGTGKRGERLANFIDGNLQGKIRFTKQLLTVIDDIEENPERTEIFGGKTVNLILRHDGAELERKSSGDQPNERYSLAEISVALLDWLVAMDGHKRNKAGRRPPGVDVASTPPIVGTLPPTSPPTSPLGPEAHGRPGRRLYAPDPETGDKTISDGTGTNPHCCGQMTWHLEGGKVNIVYSPRFRHYAIGLWWSSATQMIRYCPWCGARLPESLWDLWCDTVREMIGDDFNVFEDGPIPEEFRTDAWWRERGL